MKKWKYHRGKGWSKWIMGSSWVTKYDEDEFCHYGINGVYRPGCRIKKPAEARAEVELAINNTIEVV